MTDIEMTKLCAEAMGFEPKAHPNKKYFKNLMWIANGGNYDPLHDDAQAMALVKKFCLSVGLEELGVWGAWDNDGNRLIRASATNLNRAIVECVAEIQANK